MRLLFLLLLCSLAFGPNLARAATRPDQSPVNRYRNSTMLSALAADLEVQLLNADRALLLHRQEGDAQHFYEMERNIRNAEKMLGHADEIAVLGEHKDQFQRLEREIKQLRLPVRSSGGLTAARQQYESVVQPSSRLLSDSLHSLAEEARQTENVDLLLAIVNAQASLGLFNQALIRYLESWDEDRSARAEEFFAGWQRSLEGLQVFAASEAEKRLFAAVAVEFAQQKSAYAYLRTGLKEFNAEAREFRQRLASLLNDANRLRQYLESDAQHSGFELLLQEHSRPPFDGRI